MKEIDREKNSLTSVKKSIEEHQMTLKKIVTSFENAQITKDQFHSKAKKEMKEIEMLSSQLKAIYVAHKGFSQMKEIIDPSLSVAPR